MCVCTSLLRKWILCPPLCQDVHLFVYLCMCMFLVCECVQVIACVFLLCVYMCVHMRVCPAPSSFGPWATCA